MSGFPSCRSEGWGEGAREVRAQFRELDRRLADIELHYVSSNPRLSEEIERLR